MIRSPLAFVIAVTLASLSTFGLAQEITIQRSPVAAANVSNVTSDGDTDPQDKTQRLLLLLPDQPLVVHFDMTLHGEPFRMAREKLVDALLKAADTDGDGSSTWDEAFANPRFGFGRLAFQAQDKAARDLLMKNLDTNGDGLVDRPEVRKFLAQQFAGGAFSVANSPFAMQGQNNLRELLDTNKDKVLSSDEWAAAADRLKSRDSDDDDVVTLAELGGAPNLYGLRGGGRQAAPAQMAVLLGPGTKLDDLHKMLVERYGKEGKLRAPDLPRFIVLDKDRNGDIDREEIAGVSSMLPHVAMTAGFGKGDQSTGGLIYQAAAPSLGSEKEVVQKTDKDVALNLSSVQVRFTATTGVANQFVFSLDQAKQTLNQLDADKNGYLDEKESSARGGKQQFLMWDENGDGKVYAEEIKSFYELQQAPLNSQIQAVIAEDGDVLFSLLDTSGDGRLSLRELRNAAARLKTLDKNGDGGVSAQELPTRITVSLGQGNASYQRLNVFQAQARSAATNTAGPDWFVRMDRNGDGDLTIREFLGTPEQFKKLDADGDGFIDGKEAAAK